MAEEYNGDREPSPEGGVHLRTEAPTSTDPHIRCSEPLYPDGDIFIILLNSQKAFIAGYQLSSQVCRVASTTFAKLIDAASTTQDGQKIVRLSDCVDSESDAFRCIFSVLHHKDTETYRYLPAQDLLQVSKVNSILECDKALMPWINLWFQEARREITEVSQQKTEDLGMLLSSAIAFKAEEESRKLRDFAVHNLAIDFPEIWRKNQTLGHLLENESLSKFLTLYLFSCLSTPLSPTTDLLDRAMEGWKR
ncbi:hypothetical protein QIS74_07967 [Colletotrichum tabaci]|uniref:BTB domain-containing protein n=1 Tax=Colletotrichum tabaci TaxID=1209068 RepID=A0AAV9T6R5_9PEZI